MSPQDRLPLYDVAVIGGGIAGAGIARDAALRNLRVILLEKNTFGSGTSGKSSKLIHGGLRYLETAWNDLCRGNPAGAWKNFRFVFLSLKESRTLRRIAPELVRPIPILVPFYKNSRRGPAGVVAGCLLYALMACLSGNFRFPRFLRGAERVLKILPGLRPEGLQGGVVIWDHLADDRGLVEATIRSAQASGAEALERAEVTAWRPEKSGDAYEIEFRREGKSEKRRARKIVNASGPWVDKLRARVGKVKEDFLTPVAGSHLVFKKFVPHSVILEAEDRRIFFVIACGEVSRVGTTERFHADPDTLAVTEEEIGYLLAALARYFPSGNFDRSQILSTDCGIRPLAKPHGHTAPGDISREHRIRVDAEGVIHALGVKLTDHRRAAEEIVDGLVPELQRSNPQILRKTRTHRLLL
ncbi:MAG: FAD-dependent oxidoreductase [Candidatus Omnitrophica bacterium]|nr:FAD-dependent oxidoreductase [Candidatus Omnitrophota bacterium]